MKTESPKIGIITVLYNSEKVLPDFFKSLNEQDYKNFVLIVIDNASSDNGLLLAKKLSKEVFYTTVFFEKKENVGVAAGNNIGIKKGLEENCDMILLSNNDVVLEKNTISTLLDGKKKYGANLAVPKIFFHNSNLLWFAGGRFRYIKASTPHRGYLKNDLPKYNQPMLITYAPTCFMLIDANVFNRVGFMDEKYFVYSDDSDFVYRCNHKKEILFYIPAAKLYHKESSSTGGKKTDFSIYYQNRNAIYFTLKHYGIVQKIVVFCFYFCHLFSVKLVSLSFSQWKICLKAHIDGWKLFYKK